MEKGLGLFYISQKGNGCFDNLMYQVCIFIYFLNVTVMFFFQPMGVRGGGGGGRFQNKIRREGNAVEAHPAVPRTVHVVLSMGGRKERFAVE